MEREAGEGSLTSVEDPERDELGLNDSRDDTYPTSVKEGERSASRPQTRWATVNPDTHIEKSLYCKSLTLRPNCRYESDKINEIAAWMKTLV